MPSFKHETIKRPAIYLRDKLPGWMSQEQLDRCDEAVKVTISDDKSVVKAYTETGGCSMWKNNHIMEHVK